MVIVGAALLGYFNNGPTVQAASGKSSASSTTAASGPSAAKNSVQTASASSTINECAGNTLTKNVVISINQRHLWACDKSTAEFSSPVVTGMKFLASDLTPPGTYHIYDKLTNLNLKGSDSTGSWNDFVYYWMGFLENQYGQYGLHDATWRAPNEFGNISPNTNNASHGCVELPLATAKWLFNWTQVGTTVTVKA